LGCLTESLLASDPSVVALDDQVDLMASAAGAEVRDLRLGGLRIHADRKGYERLKRRSQEGAVPRDWWTWRLAGEEVFGRGIQQPCGERRVHEMMFGRERQLAELVPGWLPAGDLVEQE
jgi:hypothetical protein